MRTATIHHYLKCFAAQDDAALPGALSALQEMVYGMTAGEVEAHFPLFCQAVTQDDAFGPMVVGEKAYRTTNWTAQTEAYRSYFSAEQLADLLLHPPDLLLTALCFYSPEKLMEEHFYPRNPARTSVTLELQPQGKPTIFFYTDQPEVNYPDLFAGRSLAFNGPPDEFAYAYHLPVYRLASRYFPDHRIVLTSDRQAIGDAPYCYVLSPKNIYALWERYGKDFLSRHLSAAVKSDIRKGKALLILNNLNEGNQLSRKIFLMAEAAAELAGSEGAPVFYLSGNSYDLEAIRQYGAGKTTVRPNVLDTWKNFRSARKFQSALPFRLYSFPYFEEATRAYALQFYSNVNFEGQLEKLTASLDRKHFLCLNRVVKDFRVALSYFFWSHHLLPKSYVSQAEVAINYPAGKQILQVPNKEEFQAFMATLPWLLDTVSFGTNLWNVAPAKAIDNSFLWVVTETNFESRSGRRTQFLTEKTFKPMAFFMPFILVSNAGDLQRLRDMGYRTFSQWWDEGYDSETNRKKRLERIKELIYGISQWSPEELVKIYGEMREVLQHNYDLLMERTAGKETITAIVQELHRMAAP